MKKLLIIIFLLTGISFYNCEPCHFADVPAYFDVKGFRITHLVRDGFLSRPSIANETMSFWDYYGLKIDFIVDYISYQKAENNSKFSTVTILNACSPPDPGEKGSKSEKIESIKVTSVFPFDSLHLSGAEINDLLFTDGMFLDSFIHTNRDRLIPYDEIELKIQGRGPDLFIIELGYFQLKTKIVLTNGEQYESVSDTIRFW